VNNETTLVICDTEPIVVEGVKAILQGEEMPRLISVETSLSHGIESVSVLRPTVVLIDKAFGVHAVMEWVRRLRADGLGTLPVVWGAGMSEPEGLRFVQSGAAGVIRKTAPVEMLCECLRVVAGGGTWMEDALRHEKERSLHRLRSHLTSREQQVMELVEQGFKNREIATTLGICTGTVKIHLKHIFEKTGIRGRYGLALSGLKEKGLLTMPILGTV